MYQDAKDYVKEHGSLRNIPHSYRGEGGGVLCVWVSRQRQAKRKGQLSEEQIRMLEEIGLSWEPSAKSLVETNSHRNSKLNQTEGQIEGQIESQAGIHETNSDRSWKRGSEKNRDRNRDRNRSHTQIHNIGKASAVFTTSLQEVKTG